MRGFVFEINECQSSARSCPRYLRHNQSTELHFASIDMSNDHYVPQHFLRAWACDAEQKKIYAYRRIEHTGNVDFNPSKPRSIVSSASHENLYQITDGSHTAEFETSVMTRGVDTPMSAVILKLRSSSLSTLNDDEMSLLCRYVVILEGRNPRVIDQMQLSAADLQNIFSDIRKSGIASEKTIDETRQLFEKIFSRSGAASAGAYAGYGHLPDAAALVRKKCIEVTRDDARGYLTSNYPVGRVNDFLAEDCLLTIAISPSKALVFSNEKVCQKIAASPKKEVWRMIDLQTLASATDAFTSTNTIDPFVVNHLGWKLRNKVADQSNYFGKAMSEPYE